jgi:hypothetical protein
MIGAPIDLGFVIFLLIVSSIVFPIASLVIINMIFEKIKIKLLFRYIVNLFFISAFLLFQQNIIKIFPLYFITILIIECIITVLLIIYITIKVVKIWRN